MFELQVKCSLCGESFPLEKKHKYDCDLENHVFAHIADNVGVHEWFEDMYGFDWDYDNDAAVEKIVSGISSYEKYEFFDELFNDSEEWIGPILEAAWQVMEKCCPSVDCCDYVMLDEIGEKQQNELRQAISKIVHEVTMKIVREMVTDTVRGLMTVLDYEKNRQMKGE